MDEHEAEVDDFRAWQGALREQREAEYDLVAAHKAGDVIRVQQVWKVVCSLRLRADLLLAEAVRLECERRNDKAL